MQQFNLEFSEITIAAQHHKLCFACMDCILKNTWMSLFQNFSSYVISISLEFLSSRFVPYIFTQEKEIITSLQNFLFTKKILNSFR